MSDEVQDSIKKDEREEKNLGGESGEMVEEMAKEQVGEEASDDVKEVAQSTAATDAGTSGAELEQSGSIEKTEDETPAAEVSTEEEKEEAEGEQVKETAVEEPRTRRIYFRKKVCRLCTQKIEVIDYKDVDLLSRFIADSGKILPRRMTGTCARHQRMLARAIKRARIAALLPFVAK